MPVDSCEPEGAVTSKTLLGMLEFYQKQYELQREIMDRWFGYYLLIIGTPFPVLAVLLRVDAVAQSIDIPPGYLAALGFFFFGIGFLFLLMHIRQRINSVQSLKTKIIPMEQMLLTRIPGLPAGSRGFRPYRFGADFYFGAVYIFVNSAWFAAAAAFLVRTWPRWIGFVSAIFIALLIAQHALRFRLLRECEMP